MGPTKSLTFSPGDLRVAMVAFRKKTPQVRPTLVTGKFPSKRTGFRRFPVKIGGDFDTATLARQSTSFTEYLKVGEDETPSIAAKRLCMFFFSGG